MFIIKREIRFNHFNNDELEKEFEKFVDTFSGFYLQFFNMVVKFLSKYKMREYSKNFAVLFQFRWFVI